METAHEAVIISNSSTTRSWVMAHQLRNAVSFLVNVRQAVHNNMKSESCACNLCFVRFNSKIC